jgi:hypothetical protein
MNITGTRNSDRMVEEVRWVNGWRGSDAAMAGGVWAA